MIMMMTACSCLPSFFSERKLFRILMNLNNKLRKSSNRATAAWILYDFANTAFSMNIVSLYFASWLIINLAQPDILVGLANSGSMLLVALTMPYLGEISDRRGDKLKLLAIYTGLCIICTALIGVFGYHLQSTTTIVLFAISLFIVANYSYQGGLVFYNALMPAVSTPKTIGRVSGYGVAFGYLGAIAGLVVARLFVEGHIFGLQLFHITAGGAVAAFVPTAVLFLIFAIPIFIFVKEPVVEQKSYTKITLMDSFTKVFESISNAKKYPGMQRFLLAKFFYENGIQTTIVFMGVYTQSAMNFTLGEANLFFIIVIPSAVIGSALCGIFTDHYGPKKTLLWVIVGWLICLMLIVLITNKLLFWILGCIVGALLGSVWTSARPLLVSLVPQEVLGESFGLYALSGTLALVVGPVIWGIVIGIMNEYQNVIKYKSAVFVLAVLMLIGYIILIKVPDYHRKQKMSFNL